MIAAIAAAGFVQGVAPKFWHPLVVADQLSLLSTFQRAVLLAAANPENATIDVVLNEFRAHFAGQLELYALYKLATVATATAKGKQPGWLDFVGQAKYKAWEALGNVGQVKRLTKWDMFVISRLSDLHIKSAHYRGIHSDMTCGRLRKNQICTPFRVFRDCDPRVEQILKAKVEVFLLRTRRCLTLT